MASKAGRRLTKRQATIGTPERVGDDSDRVVIRGDDTRLLALVNQPLSQSANDRISRLEAASARAGQRLGNIRID